MAQSYFTFGPCVPQGSTGAANAFETLGVTVDGGTVRLEPRVRPIHSDAGGPEVEVEEQQFGSVALIDFDLVAWDDAILDKWILAAEASATLGQEGVVGALLGTGGFYKGLYLPSSTDRPWYFPTAKLMPNSGKFGSEATRRKLSFKAIRWLAGSAVSMGATFLFKRAAPP